MDKADKGPGLPPGTRKAAPESHRQAQDRAKPYPFTRYELLAMSAPGLSAQGTQSVELLGSQLSMGPDERALILS